MECFSNSSSDLSKLKNVYYILGNFTIDIHPDSHTTYANSYINVLLSQRAYPLITKPIRVTKNSATIIDHKLAMCNLTIEMNKFGLFKSSAFLQ